MKRITNREQLMSKIEAEQQTWVFFYAPLCGTCELGRSFISMVEKVIENDFVYEMDLNLCKDEAPIWEIQSVPCLVEFSNNKVVDKLYAFESVSTVYEFINNKQTIRNER
ncbi:thioredoxin family protein [Salipaludibacillus daqingensis]|uniref:thioredoxin family protein n=1 Tax=Salipaludibacillus daqingensis TaxID=3041001 RepID=UPI0024730D67|nr:thioredoxin family protein [Salipaludibacillus daqingensis]